MKNPLQTFGPNLAGRDFVIGDLHGGLPAFNNLLKNLNFDDEIDRMFSASDLVDRGPNSYECMRLMRKKGFHPCLANHEQMMLEAFRGGRMGRYWVQNGGAWGVSARIAYNAKERGELVTMTDEEADIIDLIDLVEELPFMMTINHKNGKKFHILHAELPSSEAGQITDEDLADPEIVRGLATIQSGDGDAFLWGRNLFMPFYGIELTKEKVVKNLRGRNAVRWFNDDRSMIISGHTILTQPLTILGQTNIDTCAYASCKEGAEDWQALTCIELDTWTFYQATPTTFKEVQPLTVNKADIIT